MDSGWGHIAYLTKEGNIILLGRPTDFKNTLRHIHMRGTLPTLQRVLTSFGSTVFKDDVAPQIYTIQTPSSKEVEEEVQNISQNTSESAFTKLSSTVANNFIKAVSQPTQSVLGTSSKPKSMELPIIPTALPHSITPIQVVCGKGALTGVITQEGHIFMLGVNSFGQCGNGIVSEVENNFELVQGIDHQQEKIITLGLGLEHGAAISNTGSVYTWGRGDRGQCGHGDNAHYKYAMRVSGPNDDWLFTESTNDTNIENKFIAVSCGHAITTAINAKGELWIWGKMASILPKKSIGDGEIMQDQIKPRKITFPDEEEIENNITINNTENENKPNLNHNTENISFQQILQERNIIKIGDYSDSITSTNTILTRADTLVTGIRIPYHTVVTESNVPKEKRKVVAITHGQAHTSILCNDGSIWMIGLRGRGILYDDSDQSSKNIHIPLPIGIPEPENIGGPTLIVPSSEKTTTTKGNQPTTDTLQPPSLSSSSSSTSIPIPEVRIEVNPYRIENLGPLQGKTIVKLRSSLHHSYAITDNGEVYRWGWKGIVLPVNYLEINSTNDDNYNNTINDIPSTSSTDNNGLLDNKNNGSQKLIPQELSFGYAHTIVLA